MSFGNTESAPRTAVIYALLVVLLIRNSFADICENAELSNEPACYAPEEKSSETGHGGPAITWHSLDKDEGTIEVDFDLKLWENYKSYVIHLEVNDYGQDESNCPRNTEFQHHTKITYTRLYNNTNHDAPFCKKTATIKFKYIFTGCYRLSISPHTATGTHMPEVNVQFLETKHNKTPIHVPTVSQQYRPSDSTLILTITSSFLPSLSQIDLKFCSVTTENLINDYTLIRVGNGFEICVTTETNIEDAKCKLQKYAKEATVECNVRNITEGRYQLIIQFSDPIKCKADLWGSCEWYLDINATNVPPPAVVGSTMPNEAPLLQVLVICGLITLLLFVAAVAVICWRRLRDRSSLSGSLVSEQDSRGMEEGRDVSARVLLLYARDAPLFMEVMSALRNLIATVGQCDVFDVFDASRFHEIAQDPEGWLLDKLHSDYCKTALVLSYCGFLQSGVPGAGVPLYRERACFDHLYPYALRQLIEIKNLHSYTKLFVANLSFDRSNYETCNILNPFTRYGLPSNLDTLLSDLLGWTVEREQFVNSNEYLALLDKYRNLETFCRDNPDYLKDILRVQLHHDT